LTLDSRQAADRIVQPFLEAHVETPDPIAELVADRTIERPAEAAGPTAARRERQVFGDRHRRGGSAERVLEDPADHGRAAMFGPRRHVGAVEPDAPGVDLKAARHG